MTVRLFHRREADPAHRAGFRPCWRKTTGTKPQRRQNMKKILFAIMAVVALAFTATAKPADCKCSDCGGKCCPCACEAGCCE
jgi:hypothetical protein